MKYLISVQDENDTHIVHKWCSNAAAAIAELHETVKKLRRPELPQFDCSFGEQPLPILAPSDDELAAYLNRANGVN